MKKAKRRIERQRQIARKRRFRAWKARGFDPIPWKAQVANYLSSDYDRGLWRPVFPELYEEENLLWAEESLLESLGRVFGPDPTLWSLEGCAVGAWCVTPLETALAFYQRALELLKAAGVRNPRQEVWEPHQGVLWEFLHPLKQQLIEE